MNKKIINLGISILIFILIVLTKPFGIGFNQSIILASVAMVLVLWATNCVTKTISSIFVIIIFFIFSSSDANTILKFPLSGNLVLIIASYLIAHGIKTSGLADRISEVVIKRYTTTVFSLIALSFVLSFILIFLIPQTFPRAIIMAAIYLEFLNKQNISAKTKSVILFSIFVAVTATSMAFINGDIIFNNAVLQFSGIHLTWLGWAKYMLIPTIIISILMYFGFIFIFYREIKGSKFSIEKSDNGKIKFSGAEKKGALITSLIIILWVTESLHGISAVWVSVIGVLSMYALGLIRISDLKIIKLELLLFLTAAFSIGGVLNHEGIAGLIFDKILPTTNSDSMLIFYSIIVVMILHMILGSSMTSMSLCLPVLTSSLPMSVNPIFMMFSLYVAINIHYILPLHHAVIMIGEGEGHYDTSMTVKYGIFLTIFVFISIYAVLMPYWKLIAIL